MASLAILSLLLVSSTSAAKLNALCDPALHWMLTPNNVPYNFNSASCEATLSSNSVNSNYQTAAIDVSSIFSNTANYPINFTITADPYGSVKYGSVFSADGNNWEWTWESSNDIRSITITWDTLNTDSYEYKTNYDGGTGNGQSTMSFNLQARDIVYVGFVVDESSISSSSNENVKFVYVSLNGLTRSPTKSPTKHPTTSTPTKTPTIHPSQNPSISPSTTIEPSITPSFNPTEFPTLYPSVSPTVRSLECSNTSFALVQISFNYQLQQENVAGNDIDMYLEHITDDLVQQKNSSLNGCFISKYLKHIEIDMDMKNAIINVSMCTTCEGKEINNSIFNDFEDVSQDTTIIVVKPETIIIVVDVINIDKDAEATVSTTEVILNTSKTIKNRGDDTAWIILGVLGSIVCVCILCAVARVLRLRQRDKATDDKLHEGVVMMRVLTASVANNEQRNVVEGTTSMKTGHNEEDDTGSGDQYNKGTHSSHGVEDDGSDIGTPGNLMNDDEIVIDGEEHEIGTPGDMLNDDIIIVDDDESPTNNDSGEAGTSDGISDDSNANNNIFKNTDNGDGNYQIGMSEHVVKVKDWLQKTVKFPQYLDNFVNNGYDRMDLIMGITDKSELEKIGIDLIGHRTLIMAKIQTLQNNAHLIPHAANYDLTLEGD